jgi:hypothetical protein
MHSNIPKLREANPSLRETYSQIKRLSERHCLRLPQDSVTLSARPHDAVKLSEINIEGKSVGVVL